MTLREFIEDLTDRPENSFKIFPGRGFTMIQYIKD